MTAIYIPDELRDLAIRLGITVTGMDYDDIVSAVSNQILLSPGETITLPNIGYDTNFAGSVYSAYQSNSSWFTTNAIGSAANNIASFTASAYQGRMQSVLSGTQQLNHIYYVGAYVKSTSSNARLQACIYTGSVFATDSHSGSGSFEWLSAVGTCTSATSNMQVRVIDYRNSAWDAIEVKQVVLFDLTAIYGAGNEPSTASAMDAILTEWNNSNYYVPTSIRVPAPSNTAIVVKPKYGQQYVELADGVIKIQSRYSPTHTFWIEMANGGLNNSFDFVNFYKSEGAEIDGNSDRAVLFGTSASDWLGPVQVSATANGDGGTTAFTGGYHGTNGDQTGDPTASTAVSTFYIDGVAQTEFSGYCDAVKIVTNQNIMAYNTKTTGRYVLKQTTTRNIVEGQVEMYVETEALEACSWSLWYGLQSNYSTTWAGTIHYMYGDTVTKDDNTQANNSGAKSSYGSVDRYNIYGTADGHSVWCDNTIGLGTRDQVSAGTGLAFNTTYDKAYFNIINGVALAMNLGDKAYLKGGYSFYPLGTLAENVATVGRILKNGKLWHLVDFLDAGTQTIIPDVDEQFRTQTANAEDLKKDDNISGITDGVTSYAVGATGYGSYAYRFKE